MWQAPAVTSAAGGGSGGGSAAAVSPADGGGGGGGAVSRVGDSTMVATREAVTAGIAALAAAAVAAEAADARAGAGAPYVFPGGEGHRATMAGPPSEAARAAARAALATTRAAGAAGAGAVDAASGDRGRGGGARRAAAAGERVPLSAAGSACGEAVTSPERRAPPAAAWAGPPGTGALVAACEAPTGAARRAVATARAAASAAHGSVVQVRAGPCAPAGQPASLSSCLPACPLAARRCLLSLCLCVLLLCRGCRAAFLCARLCLCVTWRASRRLRAVRRRSRHGRWSPSRPSLASRDRPPRSRSPRA